MRDFSKASGPRTVVTGATGCMYVANTSYQTTPWIIPWMHTQLGAGGASAIGMAAGLRALMRKGKIPTEKINVINFSGDLGGGDMGLSGVSGALQTDYDLLIILYDNESAANTDIQATGSTTYGAQTTFTPPGSKHRIMQRRWKKNIAGMLAVGHPTCRYVATASATFPALDFMNKVRKALNIGGPTFIHTFDPCPKGWDFHPRYSRELGELGIKCGIFPLVRSDRRPGDLHVRPAQEGPHSRPRLSRKAGPLRTPHRRGLRLHPEHGGQDVGGVGSAGRGAVQGRVRGVGTA